MWSHTVACIRRRCSRHAKGRQQLCRLDTCENTLGTSHPILSSKGNRRNWGGRSREFPRQTETSSSASWGRGQRRGAAAGGERLSARARSCSASRPRARPAGGAAARGCRERRWAASSSLRRTRGKGQPCLSGGCG